MKKKKEEKYLVVKRRKPEASKSRIDIFFLYFFLRKGKQQKRTNTLRFLSSRFNGAVTLNTTRWNAIGRNKNQFRREDPPTRKKNKEKNIPIGIF